MNDIQKTENYTLTDLCSAHLQEALTAYGWPKPYVGIGEVELQNMLQAAKAGLTYEQYCDGVEF